MRLGKISNFELCKIFLIHILRLIDIVSSPTCNIIVFLFNSVKINQFWLSMHRHNLIIMSISCLNVLLVFYWHPLWINIILTFCIGLLVNHFLILSIGILINFFMMIFRLLMFNFSDHLADLKNFQNLVFDNFCSVVIFVLYSYVFFYL